LALCYQNYEWISFPPAKTLNEILVDQKSNPQQNFNNIYQVDYSLVLVKVQGPFATHSMRKTGFVLAIWGEGADIDPKNASRLNFWKCYQDIRRMAQFLWRQRNRITKFQ
jgi:hypothetical protein